MTHDEFEGLAALDAIGAATPDEERTLRAHLADCESCRRARQEFGDATALIAESLDPVEPPAGTRERVFASIAPNVVDIGPAPAEKPRWWLAIAATLFLALWGWREIGIRVARERIRSQEAELAQAIHQNELLEQQYQRLSSELTAIGSRDTRTFALAGQQVSPTASARVFLEPNQRRAVVFFHDLPANADDRSYQLWVIRGDQPQPMSAGVFDVSESGTASVSVENLPLATEIKALAVTLEPRGGAQQPTNANFYVLGNT